MPNKRLWEVDHPYHASEGNYFSNDCHREFDSWADFLAEEGDSDLDYNLIYRWDWREGEGWNLPNHKGDMYYRDGLLCLYFIGQRKALARSVYVSVCRADEPEVKVWLKPRFEYLMKVWEPFND